MLELPAETHDLEQAKDDLSVYGLCFLGDALSDQDVETLRGALDRQAAAEKALGDLAPLSARGNQQLISNLVNKGQVFTDLVIALVLVLLWLIPEAKRNGKSPWPWVVLTLVSGSFGPLLYLIFAGEPSEPS